MYKFKYWDIDKDITQPIEDFHVLDVSIFIISEHLTPGQLKSLDMLKSLFEPQDNIWFMTYREFVEFVKHQYAVNEIQKQLTKAV